MVLNKYWEKRDFKRKRELEGDLDLKLGRDTVKLTSLDKVYWPDEGYTKGDLVRYYLEISNYIMPYLKDRPSILKRYPSGIGGQMFFQHNVESAPELLRTERVESETGRKLNYAVYTDVASLIYLVNIGTIEQHPWHSRVANLDRPDYIVFDLDPHGAPFANVLEVALAMRDVLKDLKLTGYPKTSGSSGVHIYVPLRPRYEYEEVAEFSEVRFQTAWPKACHGSRPPSGELPSARRIRFTSIGSRTLAERARLRSTPCAQNRARACRRQ